MFYYLYKITNWFNGKIYIGVHKTNDLNDGYMGSGKRLKNSIAKYGIEYFTKEILQQFDSAEAMFEAESQVVNEEFVKALDTYNIRLGGSGGWDHINSDMRSKNTTKANEYRIKRSSTDEEYRNRISENMSKGLRKHWEDMNCGPWSGKHHTEESKKRIGEANSKIQSGVGNSQYGTCWINDGSVAKKIKKEELEQWLASGWSKGRI